ncbi:cadmium resistance transporter [Ornithinibacillus xuwenensis]|uniref:Cadmium resistance transporter n=1 Tax=Ornithinibacillus xuwenensis TaxID=3144668 RepID=A0ABU9XIP4_9BACI
MGTVFMTIITFIATGLDEMIMLILLFSLTKSDQDVRNVYIGQQIGMSVVLCLVLLGVYGIAQFTGKWIGLLGFIPIVLGVMALFIGEDDDDEERLFNKTALFSNVVIRVIILAIAGGAEELAIYIPYFSSLVSTEVILASITFIIMIPIWSSICRKLAAFGMIPHKLEKYQRFIVPILFIGIGVHILIEQHTISDILTFFL